MGAAIEAVNPNRRLVIIYRLYGISQTKINRRWGEGRGMYLWQNMGTGDVFTNKFTCNFIEGEGNTGWKEAYCINPADIRRFLNRWRDEKLHRQKMAKYDRFSEKEGRRVTLLRVIILQCGNCLNCLSLSRRALRSVYEVYKVI